jgi:hypothetical protein
MTDQLYLRVSEEKSTGTLLRTEHWALAPVEEVSFDKLSVVKRKKWLRELEAWSRHANLYLHTTDGMSLVTEVIMLAFRQLRERGYIKTEAEWTEWAAELGDVSD